VDLLRQYCKEIVTIIPLERTSVATMIWRITPKNAIRVNP